MSKHILIIGAGPGGYVAAIRAAQLGAKVTLVEANKLGGTCLNCGCIPTKTYYRSAEVYKNITESSEFGINVAINGVDFGRIFDRKNEIVSKLASGIESILKSYNVRILYGFATLKDKNTVSVKLRNSAIEEGSLVGESSKTNESVKTDEVITEEISADAIIIATGSHPVMLPIDGVDHEKVLDSEGLLELKEMPKSLVIIGGGVIGTEFAMIMATLGVTVDLITNEDRILPEVDEEITKRFAATLKKKHINFHKGMTALRIEDEQGKPVVVAEDKKNLQHKFFGDYILMATGRKANLSGLGLEEIGVVFENGKPVLDQNLQTSVDGLYIIGDACSGIMLAHVASHQGVELAQHLLGYEEPKTRECINVADESVANNKAIPYAVFTFPEIAGCGMSEQKAKEEGVFGSSSKFPFAALGKSLALGETEGFIKIVSDTNHRVIGATIYGHGASSLVGEIALAIENGLTAMDITKTVHPHPTLTEGIHEAALGIFSIPLHVNKPR